MNHYTAQPMPSTYIKPTMLLEHRTFNGTPELCPVMRVDRHSITGDAVIHLACGVKLESDRNLTEYPALLAPGDIQADVSVYMATVA